MEVNWPTVWQASIVQRTAVVDPCCHIKQVEELWKPWKSRFKRSKCIYSKTAEGSGGIWTAKTFKCTRNDCFSLPTHSQSIWGPQLCFHPTCRSWRRAGLKTGAGQLSADEAAAQSLWSRPITRWKQRSAIIAERNQPPGLTSAWAHSAGWKARRNRSSTTPHCRKQPFIFHAKLLNN